MANFGFPSLTVVAPYEPHWREAQSAVGAEALLLSARVRATLAEAVADCTLVFGTGTLTHRKPEQPVVTLPLLTPFVQGKEKIALVFGPEKHGLTREDLSLCHYLLEIPTHPHQPSMNLGQAVAVCLYELSSRLAPNVENSSASAPSHSGIMESARPRNPAPPTSGELDLLAEIVTQTMAAAHYSPPAMRNANRHDLNLLLRRLAFSRSDARRALGLFRRILWQLQHRPDPGSESK